MVYADSFQSAGEHAARSVSFQRFFAPARIAGSFRAALAAGIVYLPALPLREVLLSAFPQVSSEKRRSATRPA